MANYVNRDGRRIVPTIVTLGMFSPCLQVKTCFTVHKYMQSSSYVMNIEFKVVHLHIVKTPPGFVYVRAGHHVLYVSMWYGWRCDASLVSTWLCLHVE